MRAKSNRDAAKVIPIRAYGVPGSSIKEDIETITGVNPGKNAVYTEETGKVSVTPEIYHSCKCGDAFCLGSNGGGGGGEGELFCLLLIVAVMAVFAIVWAVVMVAFSIMTIGGFIKKRYRTLVLIEKENLEFIGKLSVMSAVKGGVLEYELGYEGYDTWMRRTFKQFKRLKSLRQLSLFLAFSWGFIEVWFKLNQILINPADYNLWPFRYVMVAVFLPLLLYSPILERSIRKCFQEGEELAVRIKNREPRFSPSQPMIFEEHPKEVASIPGSSVKL